MHRPRRPPSELRLALTLGAVALGGCVLLTDAHDYGTTCRFSGDDSTPCGTCVARACGREVNACCADTACVAGLSALDACGAGGDCGAVRSARSTAGAAALAACIDASCASACGASATDAGCGGDCGAWNSAGVDAAPTPVACSKRSGATCHCEAAAAASGSSCGPSTFGSPDVLCCASSKTWQKDGTCDCDAYQCSPLGAGCSCEFGGSIGSPGDGCVAPQPEAFSDVPGCCFDGVLCSCMSNMSCQDTLVSSCLFSDRQCPKGTVRVDACR